MTGFLNVRGITRRGASVGTAFESSSLTFHLRNEESSTLRTLPQYLEEARHILALVLQIPPVDPSTGLRTYYLLRLTGDILSAIPGYRLHSPVPPASPQPPQTGVPAPITDMEAVRNTLQDLVDFLDDLDQAWLAVLKGQVWDPESAEEVDLEGGLSDITHHPDDEAEVHPMDTETKTTLSNQTDKTRLRSMLVGGESALEEWLLDQKIGGPTEEGEFNLAGMLQSMGLLEDFDNLFIRTLGYLGEFKGDSEEFQGETMNLGEEVPMSDPFAYKLPDPDPED